MQTKINWQLLAKFVNICILIEMTASSLDAACHSHYKMWQPNAQRVYEPCAVQFVDDVLIVVLVIVLVDDNQFSGKFSSFFNHKMTVATFCGS